MLVPCEGERRILTELDAWVCFSFNSLGNIIFLEVFCRWVPFPYGLKAHDTIRNTSLYIPSSTHFTILKLLHMHPYYFSLHTHITSVPSENILFPDRCINSNGCLPHRNSCHPPLSSLLAASFCCLLLVTMRRHTWSQTSKHLQGHSDVPPLANMFLRLCHGYNGVQVGTNTSCSSTQLSCSCYEPLPATIQLCLYPSTHFSFPSQPTGWCHCLIFISQWVAGKEVEWPEARTLHWAMLVAVN